MWCRALRKTSHSPAMAESIRMTPVRSARCLRERSPDGHFLQPSRVAHRRSADRPGRARKWGQNSHQPDHPHQLIGPAIAFHRSQHAHGNAETTPMMIPRVASSRVAGNTRAISSITGRPVRMEVPKVAAQYLPHINENCCQIGRLRLAPPAPGHRHGLVPGLPIASAGSIGMTRPMTKVMQSKPRKVKAIEARMPPRERAWRPSLEPIKFGGRLTSVSLTT